MGVEIGVGARAKKLRFRRKPRVEVDGQVESETNRVRENLPEEVEPGVTYRDVRVGWLAKLNRVRQRRAGDSGEER